ncbi:hypothetical protein [Allokutzneria oryzae]|uniref:Beta/gamma crystallin 'Greek key' domain-containing protein n=1 Tax=Allokutzneria oryzae TaxID=1378989 RepID=A0ABV5ZXC0_9PSEU
MNTHFRRAVVATTLILAAAGGAAAPATAAPAGAAPRCTSVQLYEHAGRSGANIGYWLCDANGGKANLPPELYRKVSSWEAGGNIKVCLYDGNTYLAYRDIGDPYENLPGWANDRATRVSIC